MRDRCDKYIFIRHGYFKLGNADFPTFSCDSDIFTVTSLYGIPNIVYQTKQHSSQGGLESGGKVNTKQTNELLLRAL